METSSEVRRLHVGKRLSEVAIYKRTVYLAGQIADDTHLGIAGQTRQALAHVDRLLAEAGSDKGRVLSCQIYLTDMGDFGAMNEVWDAWVAPGQAPPRATVEARLADPACLIEIVIVAAQRQE